MWTPLSSQLLLRPHSLHSTRSIWLLESIAAFKMMLTVRLSSLGEPVQMKSRVRRDVTCHIRTCMAAANHDHIYTSPRCAGNADHQLGECPDGVCVPGSTVGCTLTNILEGLCM